MADDAPTIQPSTQRADGTRRKERKIRPGFVSSELIPRYQPPARQQEQRQQEPEKRESKLKPIRLVKNKKCTQTHTLSIKDISNAMMDKDNMQKQDILPKKHNIYIPPHLRKKIRENEEKEQSNNSQVDKDTLVLSQLDRDKGDIGSLEDAFKRVTLQSNKTQSFDSEEEEEEEEII